MKAAVFRTVHQPLTIEDVDISAPGPHEVCVRTAAAGVCHSDVHFQQGLYPCPTPIVLGHESAGIVEAVGSEVRYVQAWGPRHYLSIRLLWPLQLLYDRSP